MKNPAVLHIAPSSDISLMSCPSALSRLLLFIFIAIPFIANCSVSIIKRTGGGSPPALSSLSIRPANTAVRVGSSQQLVATGSYSDGSNSDLTHSVSWSLSPGSGSATIDGSGILNAVTGTTGYVMVTATTGSVGASNLISISGAAGFLNAVAGLFQPIPGPGLGLDGISASNSLLRDPFAVGVDASGNVYIADTSNNRIRMMPARSGFYFAQTMTVGNVYTVVGSSTGKAGSSGNGGIAASALLNSPCGISLDTSGNLYIADSENNRIQMVPVVSGSYFGQSMSSGLIYTVAGSSVGASGSSGNSGSATSALLNSPEGVSVDPAGNLYIADTFNNRIQMVPSATGSYFGQSMVAGDIYTVAGSSTGVSGSSGDGALATAALLHYPNDVSIDSGGSLYVADTYNHRIQMVPSSSGTFFGQNMTLNHVYTVAGSSTGVSGSSGTGAIATSALLHYPTSVSIDTAGNLYIADSNNSRIQMVPVNTGSYFAQSMTAADIYTIASALGSTGVAVDSAGNIYISAGDDTIKMRAVSAGSYFGQNLLTNVTYVIAGGLVGAGVVSGSGLSAISASLNSPSSVSVDSSGAIYIADSGNNRVQMVPASSGSYFGQSMSAGSIYTVAGNDYGASGSSGDGGAATSAFLNNPDGVAVDIAGNIYIADSANNRIRMVPAKSGSYFGQSMTSEFIYTIAGSSAGTAGNSGNGAIVTSALLNTPSGVSVDVAGNLYIADSINNRIQMVPANSGSYFGQTMIGGYIYTVAGSSTSVVGCCGDGGIATNAVLNTPSSVTVDVAGNLYVADAGNSEIRMVPSQSGSYFGRSMTSGRIYTIAGSGSAGYSGNGGSATSAFLNNPVGVSVDSAGNIYIGDALNNRIQMVPAISGSYFAQSMTGGFIYAIAGGSGANYSGYQGNSGPGSAALLNYPSSVGVDRFGTVYFTDLNNQVVREIFP